MSADISSRATLNINYSGGAFQLKRCKSGDVKFDAELEVVLALGVLGGAGFREKTGGGELTLEIYHEDGAPEVDYMTLWATREPFSFTLQKKDNGQRYQFRSCRVSSPPAMKVDESGNNMDTVIVKFLQFGTL